jgi:hypothetical protein
MEGMADYRCTPVHISGTALVLQTYLQTLRQHITCEATGPQAVLAKLLFLTDLSTIQYTLIRIRHLQSLCVHHIAQQQQQSAQQHMDEGWGFHRCTAGVCGPAYWCVVS